MMRMRFNNPRPPVIFAISNSRFLIGIIQETLRRNKAA